MAQRVKKSPAVKTWVQFLGWEDPLEKGKATHSSILAWSIPWTSPWGRKESDTTKQLTLSVYIYNIHRLLYIYFIHKTDNQQGPAI